MSRARRFASGSRRRRTPIDDAVDHPLFEILGSLPNPEMTALSISARADVATAALRPRLCGDCPRRTGASSALWPLVSEYMRVDRDAQRRKRWTYSAGGQPCTWLFDPSAPPILELTMRDADPRCRDIIGSALALQQYTATFFKNNARPAGVLQAAGMISDETAERLRDYWAQNYGGSANRGKVPVLDQRPEVQAD